MRVDNMRKFSPYCLDKKHPTWLSTVGYMEFSNPALKFENLNSKMSVSLNLEMIELYLKSYL